MNRFLLITVLLCFGGSLAHAQLLHGLQSRMENAPGGTGQQENATTGSSDSLIVPKKRPVIKIDIHYHHLDEVVDHKLDSSINDFSRYLHIPAWEVDLGNLGTAALPLVYTPDMHPGFDPGFHAFDAYRFTLDSTRFFRTTHPYTLLGYLIGSKQQQVIDVLHTQNPKPNFNFGFRFRKINSPGFFQNQNTDDNSFNIFGHYNTKNKRYNAYLTFVSNKMHAGENGGIKNDASLQDPNLTDRRTIPVNLGGSSPFSVGFFTSPIATKSDYSESSWLFRQQYDWGRPDTIKVNDTTFNYEFHPSFRIEHTLRLTHMSAGFTDTLPGTASSFYYDHYGIDSVWTRKLTASSGWKTVSNDLSLQKFPSLKNQAHFLKAGAAFEYIRGDFLQNSIAFYNLKGHFEYHNLTRNHKWDLDAKGVLYLLGHNFGDYKITGSLSRYLNDKLGDVTVSFTNLNQTPSFAYEFFPSSRFLSTNNDLKKTNVIRFAFRADNDHLLYHLQANYYILTNYTYFRNFYESAQDATIFNFWQIILNKQFTAGHFNWYLDLALQQVSGNTPLHLPRVWTRSRLTYENTLYKNLNLCVGLEAKYNTPYYEDDYSPLLQQFVVQDNVKTINTLPATAAFIDFRIKAFVAYIRAENLNTFAEPNIIQVPHYPYPGFAIQVGIQWSYVD